MPPRRRNLDRRVDAALPPMALDHAGELHDPRRQRYLLTPQTLRASPPVPPFEHMLKGVPDAGTQSQPDGDLSSQLAVVPSNAPATFPCDAISGRSIRARCNGEPPAPTWRSTKRALARPTMSTS